VRLLSVQLVVVKPVSEYGATHGEVPRGYVTEVIARARAKLACASRADCLVSIPAAAAAAAAGVVA
jgi:hypothetical protein